MADPQTLIREAQEKAERLCARAVEQTPVDYQSFITLIEQRKKVGGTRHAPVFATVRQPYLSVDGRVKWARDEHLRAGKRFDVQTEFVGEPTSGQLLARGGKSFTAAKVSVHNIAPHAVGGSDIVLGSKIGQRSGEIAQQILVSIGDGDAGRAALPNPHQPHGIEAVGGERLPVARGHRA